MQVIDPRQDKEVTKVTKVMQFINSMHVIAEDLHVIQAIGRTKVLTLVHY